MRRKVSSKRTVHLQKRASTREASLGKFKPTPWHRICLDSGCNENLFANKTKPRDSQNDQTVKPQDSVSVDGFIEYQGTIHATTITNPASQQSVVDTPPSAQTPPPAPSQEVRQSMSATGTIKVLTHAARGEIDGAVLDNGTIVHFPPPVGTRYANLFQVGAPLAAVGNGTISTSGRSLEATSIGPSADHLQTVTAIDDRPRGGPGERPRPVRSPAR
jgi:hypothetical protein